VEDRDPIDATVLFLTFTDQYQWGLSGTHGIDLNCSTDVDENWYGPLCQTFRSVIRFDIFDAANRGGVCAANREIRQMVDAYRPTYVLYPCNFSGIVSESTLTAIRDMNAIVVGYFFDDDTYFNAYSKWMIPYIDYFVSGAIGRGIVARYEALGARCVLALPFPINPAIFRKLAPQEYLYDAAFAGGLHSNRRQYLSDIANHGSPVAYLGGGHGSKLHYSSLVKAYQQSRINLNFTSGQVRGSAARHVTGRIFEISMSGGFVLTEYAPGLEGYFAIGDEVACFDDAAEAAEKIKYYLQHTDEREEVARRGWRRSTNDYGAPRMLRKVFRQIEADLRRHGRPKRINTSNAVDPLRRLNAEQYYRFAQALLSSSPPLRHEWRETVALVLETYPQHQGAQELLRRAEKWGDPEPAWLKRGAAFRALAVRAKKWIKASLPRGGLNRLRWALYRVETARFRSRHRHEPASLRDCVQLRRRAPADRQDWEPMFPPRSHLMSTGAALRDPDLAILLRNDQLGEWTIAAETIEWLTTFLERERPRTVLEFGSGVSTLCLCLLLNRIHRDGDFRLLSLEQEPEVAQRTQARLSSVPGSASCRVVVAPLLPEVVRGQTTATYGALGSIADHFTWLGKADFIFIDGPAAEGPARYGTLSKLPPHVASGAAFAMDDSLREEELIAGTLWQEEGVLIDGVLTHGKGLMVGRLP
jgi:predicted O-methyltransferase YrrM